jgi:hypothetical protein
MTDKELMQEVLDFLVGGDFAYPTKLATDLRERLEQPEPDAYGYAKRLAQAIWQKHYKATAPQWKPLDDLMGVLTQIDNMTAGLTSHRQPLTDDEIDDIWAKVPNQALYKVVMEFARAIEAAHGIGEKT